VILFYLWYYLGMRIVNIKFTNSRLDKLSDVMVSAGQVFFASIFIDPLVNGNFNWAVILLGLILALSSWCFSFLIIK